MSTCPVLLLFGTTLPTQRARRAIQDNGGTVTLHPNDFLKRTGCKPPHDQDARYQDMCVMGYMWLHGCDVGHEHGFRSMPLIQLLDGTWLTRRHDTGQVDICDPAHERDLWLQRREALKQAGGKTLYEHFTDPPKLEACPFLDKDKGCTRNT
jgi:hypothetical protein